MENLENDPPAVYQEFLAGNFSVQWSNNKFCFCSVWTNMAPEQSLNRDVKDIGGLKGITQEKAARDRWLLTLHARSVIGGTVPDMAGYVQSERQKHI